MSMRGDAEAVAGAGEAVPNVWGDVGEDARHRANDHHVMEPSRLEKESVGGGEDLVYRRWEGRTVVRAVRQLL